MEVALTGNERDGSCLEREDNACALSFGGFERQCRETSNNFSMEEAEGGLP